MDGGRLGYHRALRGVVDMVIQFGSGGPVRLAIVHADGLEAARYVWQRLRSVLGELDIPIMQAGAVISTHVGLGAVAVGVERVMGLPLDGG